MNLHTSYRTLVTTIACLVLAAAGCHTAEASHHSGAESKPVVVHNTDTGRWTAAAAAWHVERTLRIGSEQAGGPSAFGEVEGLAVGADGAIYVLDQQAKEIREFDSTGTWVRTIGREGHGPGELEAPSGMMLGPHGDLWVMDPGNRRLTVFDTAGATVATYAIRGVSLSPWQGVIDTAGRLVDIGMRFTTMPPTRVLLRYDSGFTPRDTLPFPAFQGPQFVARYSNGRAGESWLIPFSPTLSWMVGRRDHFWFAVTSAYRLYERTLAGDTVLVFDKPAHPIAVTSKERDEWVAFIRKSAGDAFKSFDLSKIPATKPAIQGFTVDADGNIWVLPSRAADDTSHSADVFDPSGRYLGTVALPGPLTTAPRPAMTHDAIYTVQRDSLGVNYVERWTIERP